MTATFPQLLQQHARQRPQAPALREKEFGIWQTWSWQRALDDTRHMALGLASLGFGAGQNLAVVGDNRPLLYLMFVSVQSLGGVPVP
ncbi:MAG: AMP-binding protein, partial [Proteobacteria bacterium]|nr:AMP-binding protein [Pseudomonadota bacterium]